MNIGDRVQHNTFPPVVGTVQYIEPLPNDTYKIGVLNDETHTIYYDYLNTWEWIDSPYTTQDDSYDVEIVSVQ